MTWVKISDTFAEDPRLESAGPEALVLHVAGLCYCARQLTDGRVPARAARRLWSLDDVDAALEALVREGMWERLEDGSYRIVEYLSDQPSAEDVLEQRAQKAKRQAAWRAKRAGGRASTDAPRSSSTDASRDAPVDPAPPRPPRRKRGEGRAGLGPVALPPRMTSRVSLTRWSRAVTTAAPPSRRPGACCRSTRRQRR